MKRLLLALLVASALAGAGVFKLMDTLAARESSVVSAPLKLAAQATARESGAGSDSLAQVLAHIEARVALDDSTPVPPPVPDSVSSPIGVARVSGSSRYPWIFQNDPSGKRPIATVGGEVLLVDVASRHMAKVRVLSRYRVVGTGDESCGGELDAALSGWGYSLGRQKLLSDDAVALPSMSDARFVVSSVPARVQAAMHDTLLLAAQARLKQERGLKQYLFDEQGRLSASNSLAVFPMRLGGRLVYGARMSLNDDPDEHGSKAAGS